MIFPNLKAFQRTFARLLQRTSLIGKKRLKKEEEYLITPYLKGRYGQSFIFSINALEKRLIKATDFLLELKKRNLVRPLRVLFVGSPHFLRTIQTPLFDASTNSGFKGQLALSQDLIPGCLNKWEKTVQQPIIDYLTLPQFLCGEFKTNRFTSYLTPLAPLHRKPDLIVFLSAEVSKTTLKECKILGIPTLAIVNTQANPKCVDYVIPASDSLLSQFLIFNILHQVLVSYTH